MDVSSELNSLSENCLKHVFCHMDLKKREQMNWLFPAIRETNLALPYQLESLTIGDNYLKVNKREWHVFPVVVPIEEDDGVIDVDTGLRAIPNRASIRFQNEGYRFMHEVNEDPDVAFKKLIDEYLKHGTKIKKFKIYSFPNYLKEKNPETFQLIVEEIQARNSEYGTFMKFLPYLDQSKPLKKMGFTYRTNNFPFFNEPVVRKSEEIFLQFPYYEPEPMNDILCTLPNKHILMTYFELPIVKIQELAAHWKEFRKPIGHTYSVVIEDYGYVAEVFEKLEESLGAIPSKIPALKDSFFAHSVTIPIDEQSEIVVYGGHAPINWKPLVWALKMEVMPRGATVAKK